MSTSWEQQGFWQLNQIFFFYLSRFFGLITHPKQGVSTNIGKNFDETLQFEDFAVKNVFLFYYVHIFEKNLELVQNECFMNVAIFFFFLNCRKQF